jgi:hypothetical protein
MRAWLNTEKITPYTCSFAISNRWKQGAPGLLMF